MTLIDWYTEANANRPQHFEISCLIQEGQRAEDLLTQIIAAYLEEDANHATDSANVIYPSVYVLQYYVLTKAQYSRQASKFPQAIVGNDSSWEDDASDGGHRLGSDQLIDFEYVAVKDFWVPANPAVVIENFCTLALLEEIGNLTGCNLSLDEQNRQVAIQPGPAPDVAAAKTKLTNLEAVNVSPGAEALLEIRLTVLSPYRLMIPLSFIFSRRRNNKFLRYSSVDFLRRRIHTLSMKTERSLACYSLKTPYSSPPSLTISY